MNVKRLFMCLLTICIFLVKCQFGPVVHFKIMFIVFMSLKGSFYTWLEEPYQIHDLEIFFLYVDCLFTLLMVSFEVQKFLILLKSNLSTFP